MKGELCERMMELSPCLPRDEFMWNQEAKVIKIVVWSLRRNTVPCKLKGIPQCVPVISAVQQEPSSFDLCSWEPEVPSEFTSHLPT